MRFNHFRPAAAANPSIFCRLFTGNFSKPCFLLLATSWLLAVQGLQAQTNWDGSDNTDWFDADNWSAGIPDATDDVSIPGGMPNQPSIGTDGALAKSVAVAASATLTITVDGVLTINDWTDKALSNLGTVNNNGTIVVGSISSGTGNFGIYNEATFNNNSGGLLTLDRGWVTNLRNLSGTFNNDGTITIGGIVGARYGIWNSATFNNNANGQINIDRASSLAPTQGLQNNGSFHNSGALIIGANGNGGENGLQNFGTFNNNAGGEIKIDRTSTAGLGNYTGTFTNASSIIIGANAGVGPFGVRNQATFNNNSGGEIHIDRASNSGINNESGFTNSATIIIGANGGVFSGLSNTGGSFNNNTCDALLHVADDSPIYLNSGTISNAGRIIENASGNSAISTNSGIVQNLGGGTFTIGTNTGLLTTFAGTLSACCPPGNIYYVNAAATGANDGSSWTDAFTDLQSALLSPCATLAQIWVAEGTYKPTSGTDRTVSFVMKNGVEILGGFPNSGDPGLGDRDPNPATNGTVLSGDINTAAATDNSYHVVFNNFTSGSPLTGTAVLDGFTITGGYASDIAPHCHGGGMYNLYASPTVTNCIFSNNTAQRSNATSTDSRGGGMYNSYSAPSVSYCTFSGNEARAVNSSGQNYGGAMYNHQSTMTVSHCTFNNNTTPNSDEDTYGGGICNINMTITINDCTFSGNAACFGGGVYSSNSATTTNNCTFSANALDTYPGGVNGSGMYLNACSGSVSHCAFTGNLDHAALGIQLGSPIEVGYCSFLNNPVYGMTLQTAAPNITNCLFAGNNFGGLANWHGGVSAPVITNCTFSENPTFPNLGAITNYGTSTATLKNCILWGAGPSVHNPNGVVNISYSDVKQASGIYPGTGNINADPLFVSATDFHLQNNSPARGAATSAGAPATDFDGDTRPQGPGFDMGYDEALSTCGATGTIWYVNAAAPPEGNGSSWACAFRDLQQALTAATSGHKIWVAAGTYKPTTGTDRTIAFIMKSGVEILGGFPNTGDPDLDDRDWAALPTILSAEIGGAGNDDNSYNVVRNYNTGLTATAILDGFTLRGGKANGSISYLQQGGGMHNSGSSPTVRNCIFTDNFSFSFGGGMFNSGNNATVVNCLFTANTARYGGGAGNYFTVSSNFINCTFSGNTGTTTGGGIHNEENGCAPVIKNCIVWGNNTQIHSQDGAAPTVTYSDVQGGHAGAGNINANPLFVSGTDFHLQNASPCINVGTATGAPATDFDGDTRPQGGGFDMGYDENTTPCTPPTVNAPSVTQPTCALPTGTIVVDASGGGTLEYSVDNGATWNLDETFSGLAPGNYYIKVRLEANPSCETAYAGNPVELNSPFTASTTTDTWTGCVSTDWHTAGNWADGSVPTTAEDVIIPDVANDPVISTAAFARQVDIGANGNLMVEASGSLTISGSPDYGILNIGTVVNEGTISINGTSGFGIYNLIPGSFTNKNLLQIGNLSGVGVGITNDDATFINEGGSITIDRCSGSAIKLNTLGFQNAVFTNDGSITIGSLGTIGTEAISVQKACGGGCQASFSNTSCSALINIVASAANNVITLSGGATFDNNGGRIIENSGGNSSITSNSGYVQNLNGGTFNITTNTGLLTTATGDIWTGCTSTDWHTDGNWFDGSVPTAADDAVVPDAINDPIIGAAAAARSVNVEAGGSLTVEATGSLPINSPASPLFTNSGTVVNEGTISLNTSASFKFHRLLNLETGTFTNNNVLQLGTSGSQTIRGIYNRGSFVNATGGSISIAKCNGGIFQDAGSFVNNAGIVFSSVNNSADSTAIVLFGGTFSNTPCSATILDQPGSNLNRFSAAVGSTFTNDGLLTENSSGFSSITNNTGIVQNLGGGGFNITNNTGVLTTNPGPQTACCPPGNIFYVNAAATGANNGSSWADAFTDLQNALNSPCTGITQIWVAEGTYKPTSSTDRSISFNMKNGVEILGGFPNTGDPGLNDRDWVANVTILSGEIGAAGMADNTNSIIVNNDVNSTAVLDGFQISFGSGLSGGATFGGGLFNFFNASPTVRNCTFSSNHATYGGGVYNFQNCFPIFTNCAFIGNQSAGFGVACHSYGSSVATIINCSFSGNTGGDGIIYGDSPPVLKNCIIWGNGTQAIAGLATINHSIIQGGHAGAGNLDIDPFFVSQPPVGLGTAGDLHLQICSPAIDAANDADAPANDLDGNARFDALAGGSIADMGAYEFQDEATPTVAVCQTSVDAILDNTGEATVLATALNDGSTGCSPLVFSIDGQPSVSFDCSQIGSQSVTLTATYVNRTSTCATTVHVLDNTPPTITCPDNIVKNTDAGQCSAVATYSVTASDNCAYTLTRTSPANTESGSAFPVGITNVAWSVTDAGGNATSCAFTVTVTDVQLPGITCPGPVTVTCSGNVPAVNLAAVTATDNCGTPTKSHVGDATSNQTCANRKTVTRTYRATDGSGNSATCSQVITVFDNVKPNFTSVPANVTVQCNSIPAVGTATATDGCGGAVTVVYNGQTTESGACTDAYTLTRQWTATDACGNTKTATQRINVIDTQKPNFTTTPANVTVQCDAVPAPASPTATDNCDAAVAVTYNGQTQTNGACPNAYTLTRTWTAADNCGNTKTVTQRIVVVDNGKPVFTAFPANASISCQETPPAVGTPTASDGCGAATVTYLGQTTVSGNCPGNYQIRRTWRATDACGNSTASTQTISVSDTGAPVFTATPGPLTIECGDPLPPLVNPTASDACGGYVQITFLGNVPSGSGCAADYTVTRTWRAEDLCGNSATTSQVITVLGNSYGEEGAENREEDATVPIAHRSSLIVTPNPTTDRFWLDLSDFAGEAVTISIFDDLGRLIWERRIPAVEERKLSVSLLEAGAKVGMYTVSVRSASSVVAKRVVLVE